MHLSRRYGSLSELTYLDVMHRVPQYWIDSCYTAFFAQKLPDFPELSLSRFIMCAIAQETVVNLPRVLATAKPFSTARRYVRGRPAAAAGRHLRLPRADGAGAFQGQPGGK